MKPKRARDFVRSHKENGSNNEKKKNKQSMY